MISGSCPRRRSTGKSTRPGNSTWSDLISPDQSVADLLFPNGVPRLIM